MAIDRRTALGLIGIVTARSIGFAQRAAPPRNAAEERATAQKILVKLKEPQTVDSLAKLFPAVRPQVLSAALESLVDDETVDKWTPNNSAVTWYMEIDALDATSMKIQSATTNVGQRLSAITQALPALKPAVIRTLVQYLVEEGALRYVDGGPDGDPVVAAVPGRRRLA